MKLVKLSIIIAFFLLSAMPTSAQNAQALDSLNRLLSASQSDTNQVKILIDLGRAYIYSSSDTAIYYCQKALALAEKLQYTKGESFALSMIAFSETEKSNYVSALHYAQKSLKVATQGNHLFEKAFAYLRLASLSGTMGDIEEALSFFKKAEEIFIRLKNEERLAVVYNNIGSMYAGEAEFSKDKAVHDSLCLLSLSYYKKAEAIRRKNKEELGLATVLSNIVSTYIQLGQDSLADSFLPELEQLATKFNSAREKFNAKLDKAEILLHKGELLEAEKLALTLLAEEKAVFNKPTSSGLYRLLNELYAQKKDYEKAYQYRIIYQDLRERELYKPEAQKAMQAVRKNLEEERRMAEKAETEKEKQVQRLYWAIAGGGFLVVLLILGITYRNSLRQKQANQLLQEKNEEIAQQSEELYQINEEVLAQRDSLQKSYENVELLNEIGKKITSSLNFEVIFAQLYQSINQLMDATIFGIGIYKENQQEIRYELAMERGVAYLPYSRSMQDKTQWAVQCIEQKKEIFINDLDKENGKTTVINNVTLEDGTAAEEPQSLIYLPLMKNQDKVFGLITVQSFQKNAYSDYHLNILRNLATYTTIALENAESFNEIQLKNAEINTQREEILTTLENLQATQDQLVQSERLAVVGKLVANVAHEINTPLGAIRASAGNIVTDLNQSITELPRIFEILDEEKKNLFFALVAKALANKQLVSSREERQIRRKQQDDLEPLGVADADEIAYDLTAMGLYEGYMDFLPLFRDKEARLILQTAYHLVNQQRSTENIQVAVDRASKVVFALKTYARQDHLGEKVQATLKNGLETVLTLYHNLLKQGVEVEREYEANPEFWCYPDELAQVWTNLIHNALQAMNHKGKLTVGMKQENNNLIVSFADTGKGIPDDIKPKIFEPFFTTKPVGEGSGLGLDICQKIVKKHNGEMGFESEVGRGTRFWVRLPIEG
ncbi:ATP-binding protein [Thermoflexibacter ruber]|uniref:histidine kinase n=1 Tax=Thermoflexibacter ruber TaxID=1003 RepID=A0A1I2G6Q0_9BACT|nr:ATP-binding protein [Thermoflexibacter ruber]SFF13295.1 GAF domain-containing protein [Thermoflexibacter ruber]